MRRALILVVAAAGLLGGCSDDEPTVSSEESTTTTGPPAPDAGANAVSVSGNRFQPAALTAKAGESVTWTFRDAVGHSVTADDGSFDSGTKRDGETFTQTFSTAGAFAYHCTIHPSMKAMVAVS